MEWYEELCALDAIGELSGDEARDLRLHLDGCPDCRSLHADFCRLASDDLSMVATQREIGEAGRGPEYEIKLEQELLLRVLQTAQIDRRVSTSVSLRPESGSVIRRFGWLSRFPIFGPIATYGGLAILVVAITSSLFFRTWKVQGPSVTTQPQMDQRGLNTPADKMAAQQGSQKGSLQVTEPQTALPERRSTGAGAKREVLQSQQQANAARYAQIHRKFNALFATKEVQALGDYSVNGTLHATDFRPEGQKLTIGSRDLHILDVYPVDAPGETDGPYGRIFYVAKKRLLFYAFDLEDQKANHTVNGFQAWGYRQPDVTQPVALGLFKLDDAKLNRWVLSVNDNSIVEQIDAVFVTLEPANGSSSPHGSTIFKSKLEDLPNEITASGKPF
jgi:hypothetical protein